MRNHSAILDHIKNGASVVTLDMIRSGHIPKAGPNGKHLIYDLLAIVNELRSIEHIDYITLTNLVRCGLSDLVIYTTTFAYKVDESIISKLHELEHDGIEDIAIKGQTWDYYYIVKVHTGVNVRYKLLTNQRILRDASIRYRDAIGNSPSDWGAY